MICMRAITRIEFFPLHAPKTHDDSWVPSTDLGEKMSSLVEVVGTEEL